MEDYKVSITVLMPAYNTADFIGEAISSVLVQSFRDFELLIVNDGSKDNTVEVINGFTDERIRLINQENGGVAAALNTGLKHARGKYIARFDADDICFPERLQHQYDFLEANPDYVLIGSDADYMDQNGNYLFLYRNIGHTDEQIRKKITTFCPFVHSSVCYRADTIKLSGGYDVRAHTFEDYRLWIHFIEQGKVQNFDYPLISVRLNPNSVTVDDNLRGPEFLKLKRQMVFQRSPITEEQEKQLIGILKKQNFSSFKIYTYHILLAKKYLYNNHNKKKARANLLAAFRLSPLHKDIYILMLLSFVPRKPLLILKNKIKP